MIGRMFVGGEFYYDQRWIANTPCIATDGMHFLNGGKACLIIIADFLLDHGVKKILLPGYLCPSIVRTLERCGLECAFYPVNADLSIDVATFAQKAEGHRAVYFINYFGFFHSPALLNFLGDLRQSGVIVVEDNAQAGFSDHLTGDFVLNSLRKLTPYDGGYLITQHDVSGTLRKYHDRPNRRLPVIRAYREGLSRYLFEDRGSHSQLVELFERAEQYYEADQTVLGDPQERSQIERLDWKAIKTVRRENYVYMLSLIQDIPEISPIFPKLQEDNMPFGLPVYFSGVSRDQVYQALGSAGIGLSIHWDDLGRDPRTNSDHFAVEMSKRMLTLVIDQHTSHKQMDYLAMSLMEAIAAAR